MEHRERAKHERDPELRERTARERDHRCRCERDDHVRCERDQHLDHQIQGQRQKPAPDAREIVAHGDRFRGSDIEDTFHSRKLRAGPRKPSRQVAGMREVRFIDQGRPRWAALEELLTRIDRRGLRRLPAEDLDALALGYRAATSDLRDRAGTPL